MFLLAFFINKMKIMNDTWHYAIILNKTQKHKYYKISTDMFFYIYDMFEQYFKFNFEFQCMSHGVYRAVYTINVHFIKWMKRSRFSALFILCINELIVSSPVHYILDFCKVQGENLLEFNNFLGNPWVKLVKDSFKVNLFSSAFHFGKKI